MNKTSEILFKIRLFFSNNKIASYGIFFMLLFLMLFALLNIFFPLTISVDYSQTVVDRNDKILHTFLSKDDKWRMFTEHNEISDDLKKAFVQKEDKYFYYHPGVNLVSIFRAAFKNITQGKRTSGASTITMQVARLLYPKERTYANKFTEIFRAFQLEWQLSKNEIFQLYLNLVPYGGNIEGVKSASVLFFNKMPNHLSIAEITTLAIIPNRPSSMKLGENNIFIQQERDKWLKKFLEEKLFKEQEIFDALSEPLNANRKPSPKLAPHLSWRMKFSSEDLNIKTTIDIEKQLKVEKEVTAHLNQIKYLEIHNAAVLVLNNKTKEALAYVGSGDFNNPLDGGQVDGIRAVRQPGSTLKPLLYGLAFENGLLIPKSIMADVPVNFDGYTPANFDGEYRGYVSVEYALAQSLNIPAVKTLHSLGVKNLVEKLIEMQFKTIEKQKDFLGLSLSLGGCGVTLEEMTSMFSIFASDGKYSPLIYQLNSNKKPETKQILSHQANFMVAEILGQLERPDLPNSWRNSKNLPEICWKTGTSYGRKDAWSIGFNDEYTIGVWVGNFSGEGVQELTGANMASPLLFNIFNSIDTRGSKGWLKPSTDMPFRIVCSDSGLPPSEKCESQTVDYFIPLVSNNLICKHMQKIFVSANDSFSYCLQCLPEAGYKEKWIHQHPIEMIAYFEKNQLNYDAIPEHNPLCEHVASGENLAPKIVSLNNNATYYINQNEPEELVLKCQTTNDVQRVFWYVNDILLTSSNPKKSIEWMPQVGINKISCSDNMGRNTNITIEVEFVDF